MALSATNEETAQIIDGIGKPPDNIVLPPKDIRKIIETTAGFVARNGANFEDRIRQKEVSNPKFSFLNPNDAYGGYYLWRLGEIRAGRGNAVSAGRVGETTAAAVPEAPKGPEPPTEFHFSARMPNISAQDMDVVRLTALFAAKNGRSFTTALSQREATNYQFDFLRPQHSLYQFFSRLVDQYSELLNARGSDGPTAEVARTRELEKNINDRFHVLERARKRAEWVKYQEQQKQQKEEEDEAEKLAFAQIDWHDFVVVETVLFNEADDQADLPPPTSLSDLQSASLEQKAAMSLQPTHMRIEEAMPGEESSPYGNFQQQHQTQPQQYVQQQHQLNNLTFMPISALQPLPPTFPPHETQAYAQPAEEANGATQVAARGSAAPAMNIRNDYVPRAQLQRGRQNTGSALCPNCKQSVPYNELQEHMRIELLDPRWKEQKAKADSRYATTNLSTADVANNLRRLASQRGDVFDAVTGEPLSEEELAKRKRVAIDVDGRPIPMQGR